MLAHDRVAFADFDGQCALPSGRAHHFGGDDLLDEFGFSQTLQPSRGEDDGIVFALLEFAQAGVDVAAQGMNVEIGADGFELSLAAQAGGAHAGISWKIFEEMPAWAP